MNEHTPPKRPRGRPRSTPSESASTATVQTLNRGINLMIALGKEGDSTLNNLALTVGIPPSTAHRLLATLQNLGFVDYSVQEQTWSIGLEAFRVGCKYLDRTSLVESSRAALKQLMEATGETANLGIADQGDVVFLSQVEAHNPIRAFFRPGVRGYMHSSGIGKALLAALPKCEVKEILHKKGLPEFTNNTLTSPDLLFKALDEIRHRGWSLDDEERYLGMRCIAAPIYNAFGEPIAGISASGPTVRFSDEDIASIGPIVKASADNVTNIIGGKIPLTDQI